MDRQRRRLQRLVHRRRRLRVLLHVLDLYAMLTGMRSHLNIRSAGPADYDMIVAVMDEWWERPVHTILPRLFLDHFCDTSFLAEDVDGLAGFLIGFASPGRGGESYVHAAAVSPRHRRDGVGQALYERFFKASRIAGRPVVRAVTSPFNDQSIAFHRRLGFSVGDPVSDYDGPGLERVVFRIDLNDPDAPSR